MIHGIFYKKSQHRILPEAILKGYHPVLTLDPLRKNIIPSSTPQCWLAQAVDKAPFASRPTTHHQKTTCIAHTRIVAWASLYNREELGQKLAIDNAQLKGFSDEALILRAYLKWGEDCTQHLLGDFCFAIYNEQTHHLFCARDPMGVRPLYYYIDENCAVFSSSLSLFHVLDDIHVRPNMDWAAKFLLANMSMHFRNTAYHHIFKVQPGHYLNITSEHYDERRYFSFHLNKIQLPSSESYVDYYREQLDKAIQCRVQTPFPLGSELSGGIDSSTVTAYAAKHYPRSLNDFHTFGFAHLEDEPRYILLVNQHCNIPNAYVCCQNPANQYDKYLPLKIIGGLVEHGNAVFHEIFYDIAAKFHVRTLLSGFGGDEFVTSIHGDLYLYELLKTKNYAKLYSTLRGNALGRALRLAKLYYSSDKHKGKRNSHMRAAFDSRWPDVIIQPQLIEAYALKSDYEALGDFDKGYHSLDDFTLENRHAPFVATRMENCTLMAAAYGIEYRWPLLDPRLIQCFLSIPTSEKFHKGIGRYLHRRAISDTVPKAITWKESKSMGKRVNHSKNGAAPLDVDALHPALFSLINVNKLKQQIHYINQEKVFKPENITKIQNINKVSQLNEWLTYYFKNNCNWANMPSVETSMP